MWRGRGWSTSGMGPGRDVNRSGAGGGAGAGGCCDTPCDTSDPFRKLTLSIRGLRMENGQNRY